MIGRVLNSDNMLRHYRLLFDVTCARVLVMSTLVIISLAPFILEITDTGLAFFRFSIFILQVDVHSKFGYQHVL